MPRRETISSNKWITICLEIMCITYRRRKMRQIKDQNIGINPPLWLMTLDKILWEKDTPIELDLLDKNLITLMLLWAIKRTISTD